MLSVLLSRLPDVSLRPSDGQFAELGMKAALAALQFNLIDPNGNQKINLADLANVRHTLAAAQRTSSGLLALLHVCNTPPRIFC